MSLFRTQKFTTRADKQEFQSTNCEFGTTVPLVFGTQKVNPNLINHQSFTSKEVKTTQKSGKTKSTNIDYQYFCYLEYAIAEGVIDGIGKVWVGDTAYNSLNELNSNSANIGSPLSLNAGDNPNPTTYMTTNYPEIAVGYPNLAYAYGYVNLGNNASIPSMQFEVQGLLRSSGDGVDANPADIIIRLLQEVGLDSYVDTESFNNYRNFCREADLLMSSPPDAFSSQRKVQEVIADILMLTNAYMFWSVDKFKIIPKETKAHNNWSPNTTVVYDLTEDDMLQQADGGCVSFSVKDSSEVYNRFGLSWSCRENDYEKQTTFYENVEDISATGLRANSVVNGEWFCTEKRAITCAEMLARANNTETVRYKFKLDWAFERIEVGDLIRISDSSIGLENQVCIVDEVTFDAYGRPSITALKRDGEYGQAVYDVHSTDYNYIDLNQIPSNTKAPVIFNPPNELKSSNLEVWIALQGEDSLWGGCNVYVSDKDGSYTFNGNHNTNSIYGTITSSLSASGNSVDIQFSNSNTVEILAGSVADADNGNTLVWVNGECIAYESSQLLARNKYRLSGLRRGRFGTSAVAHNINDPAVIIDSNIYMVTLTPNYANRNLYFKFPSFNVFNSNPQDTAELSYYTHVVSGLDLKPNAVAGVEVKYDKNVEVSWRAVTNAVVERYEIRTSASVVNSNNLLYSGANTSASIIVSNRAGSLYIYAVGQNNTYSEVTTVTYSKAVPSAPNFTVLAGLHNITLNCSSIPSGCYAIKYNIVGASHSYEVITSDSIKLIGVESDIYTVKGKYLDAFGEGAEATREVTVELLIDSSWVHVTENTVFENNVITRGMIQAGAVSADKMDVTSLSAITGIFGHLATAESGERIELGRNNKPALFEVIDNNERVRVKLGGW